MEISRALDGLLKAFTEPCPGKPSFSPFRKGKLAYNQQGFRKLGPMTGR